MIIVIFNVYIKNYYKKIRHIMSNSSYTNYLFCFFFQNHNYNCLITIFLLYYLLKILLKNILLLILMIHSIHLNTLLSIIYTKIIHILILNIYLFYILLLSFSLKMSLSSFLQKILKSSLKLWHYQLNKLLLMNPILKI